MACVEEKQITYEPFFGWDVYLADMAESNERMRRKKEAKEEEEARKDEERRRRGAAHRKVMDTILEIDPKTGDEVFTRYSFTDFSIFDIDEECKSSSNCNSFCL